MTESPEADRTLDELVGRLADARVRVERAGAALAAKHVGGEW